MSSFTPSGSSGAPITTQESGSTAGVIENVDMPSGSTEYSFEFPIGTRQFLIKLRNNAILQVSYQVGESGTVYTKVPAGANLSESGLLLTAPVSIYFQSPEPGSVAEIRYWV